MRQGFLALVGIVVGVNGLAFFFFPPFLWSLIILGPLVLLGLIDFFQTRQTIRRNFPILGHFRYLLESIRPEIYQYFIESNTDGRPLNRNQRAVVYQRAKAELDTLPFGTQENVYEEGYEWVDHSLQAKHLEDWDLRVRVGGPDCKRPYDASLLNISAMSFGSLSSNAIYALNAGAQMGGFAHNTGEGGISSYHLEPGGDLIWQIGTAYFGCRKKDGSFCEKTFEREATRANVKMIEIKLSQGAKPGHGGMLPAKKITPEIAEIRDIPMDQDVLSPPSHTAFSTPRELMEFIQKLRDLSGGKPVGFKLCVGKRREFIALCQAMDQTGITPDFIAVDGGEGGTGAAPLEFSNHVGAPGVESLIFVHNALVGFGLRERVCLAASGKAYAGIPIVKRLALGADWIYSARGMMLALGCIQALRCNANVCPTGITTQDPHLVKGLVVQDKKERVRRFHEESMKSVAELIGAMGLDEARQLRPWHVKRRVTPTEIQNYHEIYDYLESGCLKNGPVPEAFQRPMQASSAETFEAVT